MGKPEKQIGQFAMDAAVLKSVSVIPDDPLLTPREVCVMLRMIDPETGKPQTGTLANWRYLGRSPEYIRLGDNKHSPVRYYRSAVIEWLEKHTRHSTSEE